MRASLFAVLCGLLPVVAYPATPEVVVLRCPGEGIQPVALAGPGGSVHLVYFAGDPAHGDLFYSVREPAGTKFSEPVRVNSEPGASIAIGTIRGVQLALGRNDSIHVAWMGSSKMRPEGDHHATPMLYSRSIDGGRTFAPQRNLITRAYGLDGGGAIAADRSGRVEVFWHAGPRDRGEEGRRIWVTRSQDNGESFSPEVAISDGETGVCGCCGMTAGADRGQTFVLYRSAAQKVERDIYLLRSGADGSDIESRRLDRWETPSCPMSSMSLAFAGDLAVAAWEAEGGDVAFKLLGSEIGGRVPHGADIRKFPSAAISPDGELLLAWVDGAGWNKGGRLAWQRFDARGMAVGAPSVVQDNAVWSKPAALFTGEAFLIIH